jgi:hypothetical protein
MTLAVALGDNRENSADNTGDDRAGLEWVSLPAVFAGKDTQ